MATKRDIVLCLLAIALACVAQTAASTVQPIQAEMYKPYARVRALVIGINSTANFRPLAADLDARAIREVLEKIYGYEVTEIVGENATKANIMAAFKQALSESGPDDVLLVFWAGHGHVVYPPGSGAWSVGVRQRGQAFLPVADSDLHPSQTNIATWQSRAVAMDELPSLARASLARHVVVFVDTCFSGIAAGRGAMDAWRIQSENRRIQAAAPEHVRRSLDGRSRFVLTAGRTGEQSLDIKNQGGLFSQELARTLREAAGPLGVRRDLPSLLRKATSERIEREHLFLTSNNSPVRPVMTPGGRELLNGDAGEFFFLPKVWRTANPGQKDLMASLQRTAGGRVAPAELYPRGDQTSPSENLLFRALSVSPTRFVKDAPRQLQEWKEAIEYLTDEASDASDPVAMAALSHAYAKGLGGEVNPTAAFNWAWQAAVEEEHPAGLYALGLAIRDGIGASRNVVAGEALIEKAAGEAHAPAFTERARARLRESIQGLRWAAETGYPPAMYLLAESEAIPMLIFRQGLVPTKAEARKLTIKAAEAGYAPAMFRLYSLLLAENDRKEALGWLTRSAEAGDPHAQLDMARALRDVGRHVDMFSEATARLNLGLPSNQDSAETWARAASEQGVPEAFVLLAELYWFDEARMLEQLQRAVESGYSEAVAIEAAWRFHRILPENSSLSFSLAQKAADQGSALGMWILALCHARGAGTAVDPVTALHWFVQAAENGGKLAESQLRELSQDSMGNAAALQRWRRTMLALQRRYPESAMRLERRIPGSTAGVVVFEREPEVVSPKRMPGTSPFIPPSVRRPPV